MYVKSHLAPNNFSVSRLYPNPALKWYTTCITYCIGTIPGGGECIIKGEGCAAPGGRPLPYLHQNSPPLPTPKLATLPTSNSPPLPHLTHHAPFSQNYGHIITLFGKALACYLVLVEQQNIYTFEIQKTFGLAA